MNESRQRFHDKIEQLKKDVIDMAEITEVMIEKTVNAFVNQDKSPSQDIIDMDDKVDQYNRDIERHAIQLLATQQPMAKDLRLISGILKIITDIERLGDYSIDIVKSIKHLSRKPSDQAAEILIRMGKTSIEMVDACLAPLKTENIESLDDIVKKDDIVDQGFREIQKHVVNKLESKTTKDAGQHEMAILLAARYLERIADHVTNVCERIYYIIKGDWQELHED